MLLRSFAVLLSLVGSTLLAACSSPVVHDLDEPEANQVVALLQQRGIAAEKLRSVDGSRVSYTIQVSRAQAADAWQVLREENLPRPKPPGVSELFGKPGLVPTATQERTLMHHALAGELSRTLQALPGVLQARVHLVLSSRDPLSPPDAPPPSPRASVLLRVSSQASALDRQEVQRLVAGSVEGLRPDAVTVVISHTTKPASVAASPDLVRLGPFLVSSGSRSGLRASLAGGLALLLLLCVTVILLIRRHRALVRRTAETAAHRVDADTTAPNLQSSLGLLSRSMAARPGGRGQPPDHQIGR